MRTFRCIIVFLLSLCMVSGCRIKNEPEVMAEIWIMGSPHQNDFLKYNYLFELNTNGTIQLTVGDVVYDIKNRKALIFPDDKKKMVHVNGEDWMEIERLIGEIRNQESDEVYSHGDDIVEITALIDNKIYCSPFFEGFNSELLLLTQRIISICEIT